MSDPVIKIVAGRAIFFCPGCKDFHGLWLEESHASAPWTWNGSLTEPTFSPSLLVQNGHYVPELVGKPCWCKYNAEHPEEKPVFVCRNCHSFIREGKIEFLSDCTHELVNQTVQLPSIS